MELSILKVFGVLYCLGFAISIILLIIFSINSYKRQKLYEKEFFKRMKESNKESNDDKKI